MDFGERLARKIQADVERQIEASLGGGSAAPARTTRLALFGLVNVVLIVAAIVVIVAADQARGLTERPRADREAPPGSGLFGPPAEPIEGARPEGHSNTLLQGRPARCLGDHGRCVGTRRAPHAPAPDDSGARPPRFSSGTPTSPRHSRLGGAPDDAPAAPTSPHASSPEDSGCARCCTRGSRLRLALSRRAGAVATLARPRRRLGLRGDPGADARRPLSPLRASVRGRARRR